MESQDNSPRRSSRQFSGNVEVIEENDMITIQMRRSSVQEESPSANRPLQNNDQLPGQEDSTSRERGFQPTTVEVQQRYYTPDEVSTNAESTSSNYTTAQSVLDQNGFDQRNGNALSKKSSKSTAEVAPAPSPQPGRQRENFAAAESNDHSATVNDTMIESISMDIPSGLENNNHLSQGSQKSDKKEPEKHSESQDAAEGEAKDQEGEQDKEQEEDKKDECEKKCSSKCIQVSSGSSALPTSCCSPVDGFRSSYTDSIDRRLARNRFRCYDTCSTFNYNPCARIGYSAYCHRYAPSCCVTSCSVSPRCDYKTTKSPSPKTSKTTNDTPENPDGETSDTNVSNKTPPVIETRRKPPAAETPKTPPRKEKEPIKEPEKLPPKPTPNKNPETPKPSNKPKPSEPKQKPDPQSKPPEPKQKPDGKPPEPKQKPDPKPPAPKQKPDISKKPNEDDPKVVEKEPNTPVEKLNTPEPKKNVNMSAEPSGSVCGGASCRGRLCCGNTSIPYVSCTSPVTPCLTRYSRCTMSCDRIPRACTPIPSCTSPCRTPCLTPDPCSTLRKWKREVTLNCGVECPKTCCASSSMCCDPCLSPLSPCRVRRPSSCCLPDPCCSTSRLPPRVTTTVCRVRTPSYCCTLDNPCSKCKLCPPKDPCLKQKMVCYREKNPCGRNPPVFCMPRSPCKKKKADCCVPEDPCPVKTCICVGKETCSVCRVFNCRMVPIYPKKEKCRKVKVCCPERPRSCSPCVRLATGSRSSCSKC